MKAARVCVTWWISYPSGTRQQTHPDAEGQVVYSGASDVVDDIDCTWTLEVIQSGLFETVCFEISRIRVMWPKESRLSV